MVGIMGGDGAGKSTALTALSNWLGSEFDVRVVHLGKPRWSITTTTVRGALKVAVVSTRALRRVVPLATTRRLADELSDSRQLAWLLCTARDRHHAYLKARRYATGGGIVVIPTVLMLLFRRKYPRWWFDWNRELYRFGARVGSYVLLLRDEYPSTDEEQAVHLEIDYPDATQLNRWLPLVKWLLAIPHYIVLALLSVASFLAVIVAWFAILLTGRYPTSLFDYNVGVARWWLRVSAYAFLLVTDRYPPFSLA